MAPSPSRKPHVLALVACLLSCLESCSLPLMPGNRERVEVVLPGLPSSWSVLSPLGFRLEWRDASGKVRSALLPPASRFGIEVPRGRPQSILAWPEAEAPGRVLAGGGELRPAGLRYPPELSGGERDAMGGLVLTWRDGWLASTCAALEAAGYSPEAFNLARLSLELEARGGDPWTFDPAEAARRLATSTFRASLLDPPPRHPLAMPQGGPWLETSALAASPVLDLPEGTWRLVGPEGELWVAMDAEGLALWQEVRR